MDDNIEYRRNIIQHRIELKGNFRTVMKENDIFVYRVSKTSK